MPQNQADLRPPEMPPQTRAAVRDRQGEETFVQNVQQAAADVRGAGRFGDEKVFIGDLHRAYESRFGAIPLEQFKAELTRANNRGEIELARADLVEAMDQRQLRESETPYLNARFHFLVDRPTTTQRPAPVRPDTVTAQSRGDSPSARFRAEMEEKYGKTGFALRNAMSDSEQARADALFAEEQNRPQTRAAARRVRTPQSGGQTQTAESGTAAESAARRLFTTAGNRMFQSAKGAVRYQHGASEAPPYSTGRWPLNSWANNPALSGWAGMVSRRWRFRLCPNWTYRFGLNSLSYKNFRSRQGVPLTPVTWEFSTGS